MRRNDSIIRDLLEPFRRGSDAAALKNPEHEAAESGWWSRHRRGFFVTGVAGVATCHALGLLWGSVLTAGIVLGAVLVQGRAVRRRQLELESELPTLLTSLASSVRAGIDPLAALSQARDFVPSESLLARELELFQQGLQAGLEEESLIGRLFQGVNTPDVELFRGVLLISRRHGSSLAEPLHRVTRVVRQRQSFRRKTRAALAMHRLSAIGISMCAVVIAIIQISMNPKGIETALSQSLGVVLLGIGACLIVVGVVWMLSLGRETLA